MFSILHIIVIDSRRREITGQRGWRLEKRSLIDFDPRQILKRFTGTPMMPSNQLPGLIERMSKIKVKRSLRRQEGCEQGILELVLDVPNRQRTNADSTR